MATSLHQALVESQGLQQRGKDRPEFWLEWKGRREKAVEGALEQLHQLVEDQNKSVDKLTMEKEEAWREK